MSRLDDELRVAFKREEPSPDFVERVLARAASPTPPKASLWRRFMAVFEMPRAGWVAAAAAASLVLAVVLLQYRSAPPARISVGPSVAEGGAGGQAGTGAGLKGDKRQTVEGLPPRRVERPRTDRRIARRHRKIAAPGRGAEQVAIKSEGELAKERLMLALQIASATLNEAQKIVKGDD